MSETEIDKLELSHHKQLELCTTRPLYRQGRKLTAVKVFTINNESEHLLIFGVPSINLRAELKSLCVKYGKTKLVSLQTQFKTEQFTECYHVHYERIQSARIAKRFLDNKSFYGGVLHVCYAPEYETINETRHKLEQRRKDVLKRIPKESNTEEPTTSQVSNFKRQINRKKKNPAIPIDDDRLRRQNTNEIWDGIPSEIDPRINSGETSSSSSKKVKYEIKKHYILPENQVRKPEVISGSSGSTLVNAKVPFIPNSVINKNKIPVVAKEKIKRIVFCNEDENKNS